MTGWLVRLRALLRRSAAEQELDDELHFHLEREIERNIANGMSATDARFAAQRAFGNIGVLKEEMRDSWRVGWLDQLGQDTRFALRSFRRSRGFVAAVVGTIALGLGLNTTVFTIFNAYVLRPIAVRDPYSIYQLRWFDKVGSWHNWTWDQFQELRESRPSAESFAFRYVFVRVDDAPMIGTLVSSDAFRTLGPTVELGRPLLPEDAAFPDGAAVMVLGHDTWRSRFGSDSSIIGRRIVLRGYPVTVVGVLSRHFQGLGAVPPDFWAPLTLAERLGERGLTGTTQREMLTAVIRLRPGESATAARASLAVFARRATEHLPDSLHANSVELSSLANALPSDTSTTWVMFAPVIVAFGLVMLIACANVANMMLARALGRQREIGIRLALGAERGRLIRQLLTESALLALPAALLGFVMSRWTIDIGVRTMLASVPSDFAKYLRVVPLLPDARVFLFIVIASLVAALLFGLAPALQATRPSIVRASRGDFDTAFRPSRLRSGLLLAQVTVCAVLLICTSVLLRGADKARRSETGLHSANVLHLLVDDRGRGPTVAMLEQHPVVSKLAAGASSPLDGTFPSVAMRAAGDERVEQVAYNFVSSGYFDVLGIPIVAGRSFTVDEERERSQVAIVSQAFVDRFWRGGDPIGQQIRLAVDVPTDSRLGRVRTVRIVGVAHNAVSGWIGTGLDRPVAYFPSGVASAEMQILARLVGNETQARRRLERDIQAMIPSAPIEDIHTLDDLLAVQVYPFAAFSWVAAALGVIALVLTITGTYGVLSYLVRQRTKEIGIRMALGASIQAVVRMVLRQSLVLAVVGLAVAIALALAVSRVFASALVFVETFDAVGYAAAAAAVLIATLVASYGPAIRAARVNPLDALRSE